MSIFNKINNSELNEDFDNLYKIFALKTFEELGYNKKTDDYYSIEDYFNDNYFLNWNNRGSYNDLTEIKDKICPNGMYFEDFINFKPTEYIEEVFFNFVELLFNLLWSGEYDDCGIQREIDSFTLKDKHPFSMLLSTLCFIRDKYGFEIKEVNNKIYMNKKGLGKIETIITDEDAKNEIYEFESPSCSLIRKQEILCLLAKYIDSDDFKETENPLKDLKNDATFLLNNFGIRHAVNPKAIALLTNDEDKEKIFDLTFDRILKYLQCKEHSKKDKYFKEIKNNFTGENK